MQRIEDFLLSPIIDTDGGKVQNVSRKVKLSQ
jgi:hypothetical protein